MPRRKTDVAVTVRSLETGEVIRVENPAANVALDVLFGRQEKIERRT